MFDRGDFAIGTVRIDRHLRRRRTAQRKHRRGVGHHGDAGNLDVVRNLGDVGSVDNLRNAGHVGIVGNVRLRLEQHCGIVNSNDNVLAVHRDGQQRSNRGPFGIFQIGNLGVSPTTALPTTSVLPITGSVGSSAPSVPTMPAVSPPATASSTTAGTIP